MALRYILHTELETRILIALFWLAAIAIELAAKPILKLRPDKVAIVLNGCAATVAAIAMKWMIEGVHPLLR